MAKRCYYEVLGVERGATDTDLKGAYRKLAMKLGEAMYKQAAEQQPGGPGGPDGGASAEAPKDDVVDAEFTEVDDDKKNKKSA